MLLATLQNRLPLRTQLHIEDHKTKPYVLQHANDLGANCRRNPALADGKVGELVGRLTEDLHASDPKTKAAWQTEIGRRIEEIQSGRGQGIPAEEVFARIRRTLGR